MSSRVNALSLPKSSQTSDRVAALNGDREALPEKISFSLVPRDHRGASAQFSDKLLRLLAPRLN